MLFPDWYGNTTFLKNKKYFGDKDIIVLTSGGMSCFKKIKDVGFDSFLDEYGFKSDELTVIEVQKIVESILDIIEDENGEVDSYIILSAFQSAMTKMLLNQLTEPSEFLTKFCELFITMKIREDVSEELIVAFNETSQEVLNKNIEEFSQLYVQNNFSDLISQCNGGEINIEELIKKLRAKLSRGKE